MTTDFFIKNEASKSLTDDGIGDYLGCGLKYSAKSGMYETMLALKVKESTAGGFSEFKYTTPKLGDFSLESRTRLMVESTGNTAASRLAVKYSKNFGGGFNVYEIAGASVKISLDGEGAESITPLSLSGIGYNVSDNLNCYMEIEVSKSHNLQSNNWGKPAFCTYLGIKYTF